MVFRVVTWIIIVIIGAVRALCENAPYVVSPPHHGDPKQARLMSDLSIMIKAEGQCGILSKCFITSKYYNRR